ncbi:hypothetical protein QQ045_015010 [Rhodiola kirilowii]
MVVLMLNAVLSTGVFSALALNFDDRTLFYNGAAFNLWWSRVPPWSGWRSRFSLGRLSRYEGELAKLSTLSLTDEPA